MLIKNIMIAIYLSAGAYTDSKELQISVKYLFFGMLTALGMYIYDCITLNLSFVEFLLRIIPGVVMLIYSKLTKEKMGEGDGIMMLILAGMLPARKLWPIWCLAFILSAITAVWMLLAKKAEKEKKMAFLPFVWIAHLTVWGLSYV